MPSGIAGAGGMTVCMLGFGIRKAMITGIGNVHASGIKETAVAATIDVTMRRD